MKYLEPQTTFMMQPTTFLFCTNLTLSQHLGRESEVMEGGGAVGCQMGVCSIGHELQHKRKASKDPQGSNVLENRPGVWLLHQLWLDKQISSSKGSPTNIPVLYYIWH